MKFSPQNAILISGLTAAAAYGAYHYNLVPKKVAVYGALGIAGLAFVATEVESLSESLPITVGVIGACVAAILILV